MLEGGDDADLGQRQRKSGLCKWLTAEENPQQKGVKAKVYLSAVKRGCDGRSGSKTLRAGIIKQRVTGQPRRRTTKLKQKPSDGVGSEGLGIAWRYFRRHLNVCVPSACG